MDARLDARPLPTAPPLTLGELFLGFLSVALSGFGGVMPWARRMMVEQRRWLTAEEFTDILALCQFLPGPNIVNVSICVGTRFRGAPGAVAAFAGLMIAPFSLTLALGALYTRFGQLEAVRGALGGVAAVAAGLLIAMGLRMAEGVRRSPRALLFAGAVFVAVGLLGWPLVRVILVLTPLSIAAAWWRRYR